MSFALSFSTAAVALLLMCPRAGATQNGGHSSAVAPIVELLDNRSTYCTGETARIRCNISGSGNNSSVVYDWVIGGTNYNPAAISVPGHTVSSSDRFVLEILQTEAYSVNYSCSLRIAGDNIKSTARLLTFAESKVPAITVACANTTSNSVTVLMKETNKCRPVQVDMTIGSGFCLATGPNLYLCAGLRPKTTYTISARATTSSASSNGSTLATTLGTTVCTTGNHDTTVGVLAALVVILTTVLILVMGTVIICKLKRKLHSQEATVTFTITDSTIRVGEHATAVNDTSLSKEEEVNDKGRKESDNASGVAYAELDFAGRTLPVKPPPAFEEVQYADVH